MMIRRDEPGVTRPYALLALAGTAVVGSILFAVRWHRGHRPSEGLLMNSIQKANTSTLQPISAFATLLFLISGCNTTSGQFTDELFTQSEIETGEREILTVIPGYFLGGDTAEIAVVQMDENRNTCVTYFGLRGQDWVPVVDAVLEPGVLFVDVVNAGGQDRLMTFRDGLVNWLDPATTSEQRIAAVATDYRAMDPAAIPQVDITRDLNGDGRDDVIVPDVDGFWIAIQLDDGTFVDAVKIGPPEPFLDAIMADQNRTYREIGITEETVPWYLSRVHQLDYDLDDRRDLAFWNMDHFDVYRQDERGRFSSAPMRFDVDVAIDSDGVYTRMFDYSDVDVFAALVGGDERSERTVLHTIRDLNGDDVADLATMTLTGRSILKQRTDVDVYFGASTPEGIVYQNERRATFRPKGTAGGMQPWGYSSQQFKDLDGDGVQEAVIYQVSTGLDGMLRAMLGKSVAVELEFYSIEGHEFPAEASVIRTIKPRFDPFISGVFFPPVHVGDLNGDARMDLIVGESPKELRVFVGVPNDGFFALEPQRISVDLPQDERNVLLTDLNRDERQDLVISHTPPGKRHRLVVLMASEPQGS